MSEEIERLMVRYNLDERQARIAQTRSRTYGDPRENHQAIAQAWSGLLQPHAHALANMEPLPEHVVALMLAMLKVCRARIRYHEDNYDDACVYLGFAHAWQREHEQ